MNIKDKCKKKSEERLTGLFVFSLTALYTLISYRLFGNKIPNSIYLIVPLSLVLIDKIYQKITRDKKSMGSKILYVPALISLIILFLVTNVNLIQQFYSHYLYYVENVLIFLAIISKVVLSLDSVKNNNKSKIDKKISLFNIIYMNYSKSHEIAMLINNNVNKTITVGKEEQNLNNNIFNFGQASVPFGMELQSNVTEKSSVLHEIQVKETKSIILRNIYELLNDADKIEDYKTGQLIILKNREIKRINVADTFMLLNVLKDSNIANQIEENIEINMNKLMETVLDDFTIDYTLPFGKDNEEFLLQLPFSDNDNFENGYKHHDLQLGKVSIIGIYKGEIDFSLKETVSSKFLEVMNNTVNENGALPKDNAVMKTSDGSSSIEQVDFKFEHKKLEGKFHLVDVISIIQELEINEVKK